MVPDPGIDMMNLPSAPAPTSPFGCRRNARRPARAVRRESVGAAAGRGLPKPVFSLCSQPRLRSIGWMLVASAPVKRLVTAHHQEMRDHVIGRAHSPGPGPFVVRDGVRTE